MPKPNLFDYAYKELSLKADAVFGAPPACTARLVL